MRVYLDNCCYNRPFDEQTQLKVRLETEAKLRVQAMMRNGEVEYVWSDILSQEVLDNPFPPRREKILEWRHGAFCTVEMTADCDYFITTDIRLLRRIRQFKVTRILNPMEFLLEVEDGI